MRDKRGSRGTRPTRPARSVYLLAALTVVVAVVTIVVVRTRGRSAESIAFPEPPAESDSLIALSDFAGADVCASCHREQHTAWRASTHGRAGGAPSEVRLLRDFDERPIRFRDAVVTPRQRDGRYEFAITWNDTTTVFVVDGVVGGGHLIGGGTQGFVTRHTDGSLRLLPFELEGRNGQWFCNTTTRSNRGWLPITLELSLVDCGDWPPTRMLGSSVQLGTCQECHASRISRERATYAIDCESCHGPAQAHVSAMRAGGPDPSIARMTTASNAKLLDVCLQCHALKDNLRSGYVAGGQKAAFYSIPLALVGANDLHADGRTRTFAYQEGHLFSDCYLKSGMSCNECHEPHGQSYRDFNGIALKDRFDDRQCTACHPSKADRPELHSKHPAGSEASRCVTCHMPYLQQPDVGAAIAYARSDHTIGIPRPANDSARGIAYACQRCHQERGTTALQQAAERWWGPLKPQPRTIARLSDLPEDATQEQLRDIIVEDDGTQPLPLYNAIGRWLLAIDQPGAVKLDRALRNKLHTLAADTSIERSAIALAALHLADGTSSDSRRFLAARLSELGPNSSLVRSRWAAALGYAADQFKTRNAYAESVEAYRKALEIAPSNARIWMSYGSALLDAQRNSEALQAFDRAVQLAPTDALALVNLGLAYSRSGDAAAAQHAYERALRANPNEPLAHFNLANVYARSQRLAEAVQSYEKAIALNPALSAAHFNLARVQIALNQPDRALRALRTGLQFAPNDAAAREMLAALQQ